MFDVDRKRRAQMIKPRVDESCATLGPVKRWTWRAVRSRSRLCPSPAGGRCFAYEAAQKRAARRAGRLGLTLCRRDPTRLDLEATYLERRHGPGTARRDASSWPPTSP